MKYEQDIRLNGVSNVISGDYWHLKRLHFEGTNDMEKLFGGVNLLAPTATGKCVFENFMAALSPILERGAESCAKMLLEHTDAK